MQRILISAAVGFVLLGAITAPAQAGDGAQLYGKKCAMCHGKDGVAKKMGEGSANLNDPEWQEKTSVEDLVSVTTDGVEGTKMPGYGSKLSSEEIQAIAEYIKTL